MLEINRVEDRHPLYSSKYSLYLSPKSILSIADPIEQIIYESSRRPEVIYKLLPRDFERFLAKIFEGFGYQVELTSQTRDGGADLICVSKKHGIPLKLAVEAKRYAPDKPVTVNLVRQFVGANKEFKANKLIYVCTSSYTKSAIQYANMPSVVDLLELKNFKDILHWANQFIGAQGY